MSLLLIIFLFLVKHCICDFFLQSHYQISHKINYGHPGGVLHACIHGIGTFLVVMFFYDSKIAAVCAIVDIIIHYHIDFLKAYICNKYQLNVNNAKSKTYWKIFGVDQLCHQATYLGLIIMASFLEYTI